MKLVNQQCALSEFQSLAESDRHSILIEGIEGCGKTYLAKKYSELINCDDFQVVEPKVQSIKDAITTCYQIDTKVVICIENLDSGVLAASYALLKFLEEPANHVYIVVTCRNIQHVPDTIVSRSAVVTVPSPKPCDLVSYAQLVDNAQYSYLQNKPIWQCAKTFKDVDTILTLTPQKVDYYNNLNNSLKKSDSIYNMMWALQKYPDGSSTPLELVIRYIMYTTSSNVVWSAGHECLKELIDGRIANHAVLAKFLFEFKYTQ